MIETVAVIAAGAAAAILSVPISAGVALRQRLVRRAAWIEAAHAAGLRDVEPERSWLSFGVLRAHAGRSRVRVEEFLGSTVRGQRLVIEGGSGVSLRPEAQVTVAEKALRAREIEIGDEAFDDAVYVQGDPEVLRAVLDAETRLLVRDLLGGPMSTACGIVRAEVVVRDGSVVCEAHYLSEELRESLGSVLERLVGLARRLEPPAEPLTRLAENTAREPEWRVRLINLRFLTRNHPRHPATRQELERARHDGQEEVQLEAALGLGGDEGRALLTEIASREGASDAVAARAVAGVEGGLPLERTQAILGHALRTRRVQTARACIELLGRSGEASVAELLVRILRVETGELAAAAVGALGSVGTAGAVAVLREVAEQDRGLAPAARQAIAAIRARIDHTPGQLTLASEGESGQVSLAAEGPGGAVSIAGPTSDPGSPASTSAGRSGSRPAR